MSTFHGSSKEKFLSLSSVSSGIRDAIAARFGEQLLWIVAEISDLNIRKGHCYLSLVEKLPGNTAPICELKGIVWANKFEKINSLFREVTGINLSANTKILFQAYVRYDVKWGLNLIVEDIEPKYTAGLLLQERAVTVAKLKEEGIYANNKKLSWPLVPLRIAAISAKDSRGFEDFANKLHTNPYGYKFEVTLFSSLLQGEKAASEMVSRLIEIFNHHEQYDVVVIVRGGGGTIDLNCFNDYKLSRAVARFPLPVLTGIGHKINISVVDEVAHANRITPTDAADFIVQKTVEFEEMLGGIGVRIQESFLDTMVAEQSRLQQHFNLLKIYASQNLRNHTFYLNTTGDKLNSNTRRLLREFEVILMTSANAIRYSAKQFFTTENEKLKNLLSSTKIHSTQLINTSISLIDQINKSITHLDPVNVLKRGFSITKINGKAIKNAAILKEGDTINTIFYEGNIESEIKRK